MGCSRKDEPECVFLIRSIETLFPGLSGGGQERGKSYPKSHISDSLCKIFCNGEKKHLKCLSVR